MLSIWGEDMEDVRNSMIDNYAVKILTSGYSIEQTRRRMVLSGLRGYEARMKVQPIYKSQMLLLTGHPGALDTLKLTEHRGQSGAGVDQGQLFEQFLVDHLGI